MKDAATADRSFTPRGLAWVALLVVLTAIVGAIPTPDVSSSMDFSTEKALDHIAAIAQQPHPIGSPAAESARRYIVEQLEDLDLYPELQEFEAPDFFGISDGPVTGVNVAARISGTDSSGAVMLVAHYDTVPTTPGAADDASGVAVVLETARALQNGPPLRNDVILLLTDGEEPAGRYGATAFVERHPWAKEVAFVVNFEACGTGGPSLLVQTSGADGGGVNLLAVGPGHRFLDARHLVPVRLAGNRRLVDSRLQADKIMDVRMRSRGCRGRRDCAACSGDRHLRTNGTASAF